MRSIPLGESAQQTGFVSPRSAVHVEHVASTSDPERKSPTQPESDTVIVKCHLQSEEERKPSRRQPGSCSLGLGKVGRSWGQQVPGQNGLCRAQGCSPCWPGGSRPPRRRGGWPLGQRGHCRYNTSLPSTWCQELLRPNRHPHGTRACQVLISHLQEAGCAFSLCPKWQLFWGQCLPPFELQLSALARY